MKINTINNTNFNGKPPELLAADKVLRLMNTHYPTVSCSRFKKFRVLQNNTKLQQALGFSTGISCAFVRKKLIQSEKVDTPLEFFKGFFKTLKNHKVGNCFEMVKLFSFIMDLNGIEPKWGSILPSEIDHCIALIPLKEDCFEKTDFTKTPISKMKDFLIADPWLGIVDYAPNIATLYKNHPDYNRCVGSPENFENWNIFIPKFMISDYYLQPQDYHSRPLSPEDKKFFTLNYPELLINKKQLIKH